MMKIQKKLYRKMNWILYYLLTTLKKLKIDKESLQFLTI